MPKLWLWAFYLYRADQLPWLFDDAAAYIFLCGEICGYDQERPDWQKELTPEQYW